MAHDDPTREDTARPKADPAIASPATGPAEGDAALATAEGAAGPAAAHETPPPAQVDAHVDAPMTPSASGPGAEATPRAAPDGTMDDPLPPAPPEPGEEARADAPGTDAPKAAEETADEAAFESAQPMLIPPPAPAARGASPWLALLLGMVGGAVVAGLVVYGLASRLGTVQVSDEIQPLTARISTLEARGAADPRAVAALTQRVDKIEAAAAQQPSPEQQRAATAQVQADIASLRTGQQSLQGAVKDAATAAAGAAQQVTALGTRIDQSAAAAASTSRAAAAIAVLAVLNDAIVSGRPFAAELDAARAVLGATAGTLDPFAEVASVGFSPPAKLASRLQQVAAEAASGAPAEGTSTAGSVVNRLLSSAESLVKVRPADTAPTPEVQATLDQALAALRAGDFDTALARLDALPQGTKDKLKSLIAEIQQRRNAANAVGALYLQALAAISGKVP
ncbi:COG4223 family protein [Roseixanthobacter glucoisosaccharinicivorans]|uniref:COG4223 family protein n=1 Tax=Roseixanthobacter glucoisosaccharinicivorans TaxID=3119923 RepID=UPI00372C6A85